MTDRGDTPGTRSRTEVLLRAVDAGPTYLAWRWLDDVATPHYAILDPDRLRSVTETLDTHLILLDTGDVDEHSERAVHAVRDGAFASPDTEEELSAQLARTVLPEVLLTQIHERLASGVDIGLRLTPSPALARIPWEILPLYPHRARAADQPQIRLIEALTVTYDPPATVRASRSRRPDPAPNDTAVLVIDPKLPARAVHSGLKQALSMAAVNRFADRIEDYEDSGHAPVGATDNIGGEVEVTRLRLSEQLLKRPARLFYFGHISSQPDEPGTAALHLSDTCRTWGRAEPYYHHHPDRPGATSLDTLDGPPSVVHPDDHRPLCALDLLLGTLHLAETDPDTAGTLGEFAADTPGHEIWPMPPRVAMIACEGAADYRSSETFGLVMAAIDAGATLVTTTRWPLPTDQAFRQGHPTLHGCT